MVCAVHAPCPPLLVHSDPHMHSNTGCHCSTSFIILLTAVLLPHPQTHHCLIPLHFIMTQMQPAWLADMSETDVSMRKLILTSPCSSTPEVIDSVIRAAAAGAGLQCRDHDPADWYYFCETSHSSTLDFRLWKIVLRAATDTMSMRRRYLWPLSSPGNLWTVTCYYPEDSL